MSKKIGSLEELAAFMKERSVLFTEDGHPFVLREGFPGMEYRAGSVIRFQPVEPGAMVAWLNQPQASRKADLLTSLRNLAEMVSAAAGVATVVVAGLRTVNAFVNPKKCRRLGSPRSW